MFPVSHGSVIRVPVFRLHLRVASRSPIEVVHAWEPIVVSHISLYLQLFFPQVEYHARRPRGYSPAIVLLEHILPVQHHPFHRGPQRRCLPRQHVTVMVEWRFHHRDIIIHVAQRVFRRVNINVTAHPYQIVRVSQACPQHEIFPRGTRVVCNALPRLRLIFSTLGVEHPPGVPFVVLLPVVQPCRFHVQGVYTPGEIQSRVCPEIRFPLFLV